MWTTALRLDRTICSRIIKVSCKVREKRLYGKFLLYDCEVTDEGSWQWLTAGYLRKSKERYVIAAQEQALRTKVLGDDWEGRC
jgi:hypothetical protein